MTVHCLKVTASIPSDQFSREEILSGLSDLESNLQKRLPEQEVSIGIVNDEPDVEKLAHIRGILRSDLEQNVEQALVHPALEAGERINLDWVKIEYHECNHDQTDGASCSWEQTWTHGSPPGGV